jgi:hypothetical protein
VLFFARRASNSCTRRESDKAVMTFLAQFFFEPRDVLMKTINLRGEHGHSLFQLMRSRRLPDSKPAEGLLKETDDGGRTLLPSEKDGAVIDQWIHTSAPRLRTTAGRHGESILLQQEDGGPVFFPSH